VTVALRSAVFVALFYLWWTVLALGMLPLLILPRAAMRAAMRLQAKISMALLRLVCGVRVEFRGLEHLSAGAVLIAAKHQCMFDTIAPMSLLADSAFVMRDSLLRIPFYGWYALKAGMIPVDRQGKASALRALLARARAALAAGRQVVIFPEGTRVAPGATGVYKPGVAAIYRGLEVPCLPMATNSGAHWPAHGLIRQPGVIVYEFLEPIPAGLDRKRFMAVLEERIETASTALLAT
jgi:1-acyl-sn-glycerol-3-phosphate acyltransferase